MEIRVHIEKNDIALLKELLLRKILTWEYFKINVTLHKKSYLKSQDDETQSQTQESQIWVLILNSQSRPTSKAVSM